MTKRMSHRAFFAAIAPTHLFRVRMPTPMLTLKRSLVALLATSVLLGACSDDDDDSCASNPTGPGCTVPPGAAEIAADITQNRTFHSETTYTLTKFVHVNSGATLTIEPGTTIKGRVGSALFIMRGAKLMADGRADAPIVFTSDQAEGSRKPGDWGGLVIIGNGVINRAGVVELEGTGSSA